MNDGQAAKQQIAEQLRSSSNILVTVNADPSVDELAAALGLTILLNNQDKHATAVVSGKIPPAITFLDPEKTFENTVDSLRDFIIALDKEKADHLRYKVDGDVVKIFITPYRTTISEDDLDFSQGDYNVEIVVALGVKNKDRLDKALEAHGRILHDATVVTISCDMPSDLGSIDWCDPGAGSISEMLVSLSEALKTGDSPVIDEQIATAFLTGIVASTDRFSNERTTSKVMTMAAQLMAAGANQQLIAAKLEEAHEITSPKTSSDLARKDGTTELSETASTKLNKDQKKENSATKKKTKDTENSFAVSHERTGTLEEIAQQVAAERQEDSAQKAEDLLSQQIQQPSALPPLEDLQKDIIAAGEQDSLPKLSAMPPQMPELQSNGLPDYEPSVPKSTDPAPSSSPANVVEPIYSLPEVPPSTPIAPMSVGQPTLAQLDQQNRSDIHQDAMSDVHAAYESSPVEATQNVSSVQSASPVAPPAFSPSVNGLPPLPDFSVLPPPPPPLMVPARSDIAVAAATPSLPPIDPPQQLGQIFGNAPSPASNATPPQAAAPNDPGQFRIPGQG